MENYYGYIPLAAFFVSSLIWVYIYSKRSNKINTAFLFFTANLLAWEFSTFLCYVILPEDLLFFAFKISSISWFLIGVLFLNFTFVFIGRKRDVVLNIFFLMSFTAIVVSLNTDLVVKSTIKYFYGNGFLPGPLYFLFVVVVVLAPIAYAIFILYKVLLDSKDKATKTSLSLLIFGISISTILSTMINVFLPHLFNNFYFAPYSSTNSLILLFFVLRAILKHNFLSLTEEEVTINLLENLGEGVILTDNNNYVMQINDSAREIFNLTLELNLTNLSINSLLNNFKLKFEAQSDSFVIELNNKNEIIDKNNESYNDSNSILTRKIFLVNYSQIKKGKKTKGKIFIVRDVTLSVTAEEVLKKSKTDLEKDVANRTIELTQTKNQIESIYNSISESIVTIDKNFKILSVNDSFNKLYYFSNEEIIGKDISTLFAAEEYYTAQLQFNAFESKESISFDSYNSKKDGSTFPVSISAVKMQKEINTQKTFQILLSISDLTDRKIIEAKMKDSRNKGRMVIQNINEAIFVIQKNRIKYFINAKLPQLIGYSLEELVALPFLDFVHPDEQKNVGEIFNKIEMKADKIRVDEKVTKTTVFRMVNSSGNVKWVEINIILKKWNGKPAFLIYLSDITERKKAEINLVENENQFRAFIDQANDFIIIKDLKGRYLKANEKFCDLLNLKEEEIVGKSPKELGYPDEFINETEKIDNEVIKDKKIIIENNKASKSSSDGVAWLEVTTFPILGNKNEVKYIGVLSRDVTAQKNWEDEISSQHEKLQHAHGELTKSHEIIVKQEKLASLGTMAAGIAHEINNPAQVVKFSMQSLEMNIKDINQLFIFLDELRVEKDKDLLIKKVDELNELMEELDIEVALEELNKTSGENTKSIERIEHIIKSTKRLAYNDLEFTICDVNEIIKDSLTLVDNNIKYHVNITKSLASDIPKFKAISSELTQVIINLVNNSKDSILEKDLKIDDAIIFISSSFIKDSSEIKVVIEDNGIGISDEILNKIYDPFFTTKKVGKGTGLGLNIVHRIVKAHKGEIKVESKLNVGTKFIIKLPLE